MYYSIYSEDCPDSLEKRKTARAEHLLRVQQLQDEGRLLLAGPHPNIDSEDPGPAGFSGSLIVAEFETLQEAEEWAADDPFQHAGVYVKVSVKPFKKILPA
ncbi:MAG: hypothetical protein ACI909_000781 [Planctomycetota bacterium]|jgi:uncharacterized protein YciI